MVCMSGILGPENQPDYSREQVCTPGPGHPGHPEKMKKQLENVGRCHFTDVTSWERL